jgi:hypothetical protein
MGFSDAQEARKENAFSGMFYLLYNTQII